MEQLQRDSSSKFSKNEARQGGIPAGFRVNSSGVGDDMVKHEPSVTARSNFMNAGLSFNSGSCGSLQTGGGE
jgi:hypothetical protein